MCVCVYCCLVARNRTPKGKVQLCQPCPLGHPQRGKIYSNEMIFAGLSWALAS